MNIYIYNILPIIKIRINPDQIPVAPDNVLNNVFSITNCDGKPKAIEEIIFATP